MPVPKKEKFAMLRQAASLLDELVVKHHDIIDPDDISLIWDLLERVGESGLTMVEFDTRGINSLFKGIRPLPRSEAIEAKQAEIAAKSE